MQAPFMQHPVGHDVPLHTQAPLTQALPLGQEAPPPQVQAPAAEQVSAAIGLHAVHAPPAVPQLASARGRQKPPAQQPSGQLLASQVPPLSIRQMSEQPSPEAALP